MKKVISIALALLMVAVMLPVMAAAADAEYDITTEEELRTAVGAMNDGGNVTVRLKNDVTVVGDLKVKAGTLTILGQGHKITFSHHSLVLSGTAMLNLGTKEGEGTPENKLILTSEDPTSCVVVAGGSSVLNMYHGVEIRDSIGRGHAAGVQLEGNSVFNMYGGVIENCVNEHTTAGGVHVTGGSKFYMYDGAIRNCTGVFSGAISIVSTTGPASFIMDNGTITGCSGDNKNYGGAVVVSVTHPDAVIEINKGEITGNSGAKGGGIYVDEGTVKIADGVALHSNKATVEGDDLYNKSGSVTLGKLPTGLKLAACGCDIDGWYHDKTGARWSSTKCGGGEDRMEKHTETAFTDGRALKAAHGEAPAPPIIIVPEAPEQEAPNPTTGSRDLVGVAAAMAAVSLLGAAAVIRKK